MFRRQLPLWQTYRPEQRPATRRREGEARCNYARAGDHGMRAGYSTITTPSVLSGFFVGRAASTAKSHSHQAKLQELNWDTVPHPPYSPDIAPSDYHLFCPLKLFLKEKRFAKYEDLKMAVFDFFDSQSAAFWKKGIDDLPEHWLTVVTNDGQYIVD
uniref:Histone-lysine N-methyltransferase SETMAR n=1 Tax=Caenorhabditis japonica TaxID=281687 RepID=A0A8R1DW90_CAEJA